MVENIASKEFRLEHNYGYLTIKGAKDFSIIFERYFEKDQSFSTGVIVNFSGIRDCDPKAIGIISGILIGLKLNSGVAVLCNINGFALKAKLSVGGILKTFEVYKTLKHAKNRFKSTHAVTCITPHRAGYFVLSFSKPIPLDSESGYELSCIIKESIEHTKLLIIDASFISCSNQNGRDLLKLAVIEAQNKIEVVFINVSDLLLYDLFETSINRKRIKVFPNIDMALSRK